MTLVFTNLSERDDDRAVLVRIDSGTGPDARSAWGISADVAASELFELGATGVEERTGPDGGWLLLAGFPNRVRSHGRRCDDGDEPTVLAPSSRFPPTAGSTAGGPMPGHSGPDAA